MMQEKKRAFDNTVALRVEQNTLYVYAGVEGAGKTSISGVLNACCTNHLETTLVEKPDLEYIRRASEQGYYIHMFYMGLDSLEEHLMRIKNRVRKGGQDADPAEVERQFRCRWSLLESVLPLCHEVSFLDSTNGMNRVATYRDGQLLVAQEAFRCKWFQEWYRWHQESMNREE